MVSEREIEAAREAWREYWSDVIVQYEDNKGPMEGMRRALEAAARVRAEDNAEGMVKPLNEDDYEEIISAAAINMRKATSGIRGQVVTVQDSLDWWVMKETEHRILSALTAGKPEQVPSGWQPIETAPKDGTYVLLSNEHGTWVGHYVERYTSGYRPKEPWRTMMMNHWHMKRYASTTPTHWMPLPTPPTAGGGDAK